MPDTGFGILADWIQIDNERSIYVYWDITPDRYDERSLYCIFGFDRLISSRYIYYWEILHTYVTRWIYQYYKKEPISEKNIFGLFCTTYFNERNVYYYLDESLRLCYVEGLLTQTPLLLKYPKYYNWDKIPRILTPEFKIWSYYDLDYNSINVHVTSSGGFNKMFSLTLTPDKISITKETDKIYSVKVIIDHIFNQSEEVHIYICAFDVKGNYLKPGLW